MIAKCSDAALYRMAPVAPAVENNAKGYRLSTKDLTTALFALNTAMAAVCCCYNPTYTLGGAIAGVLVRRAVGDNPGAHLHISENERRTNRIAFMCLSAAATLYTAVTNDPTSWSGCVCPALIGFQGATNGIYPFLRKIID